MGGKDAWSAAAVSEGAGARTGERRCRRLEVVQAKAVPVSVARIAMPARSDPAYVTRAFVLYRDVCIAAERLGRPCWENENGPIRILRNLRLDLRSWHAEDGSVLARVQIYGRVASTELIIAITRHRSKSRTHRVSM